MKHILKKFITFSLAAALAAGAGIVLAACEDRQIEDDPLCRELLAAQTSARDCVALDMALLLGTDGTDFRMQALWDTNSMQGDFFSRTKSGGTDTYLIEFVRGNAVYTGEGSWPDAGGFDAVTASYRTADGPLLERTSGASLSPALSEGLSSSAAVNALKNLPLLLGAKAEQKNDGYVIEFDLVKGLEKVAGGILGAFENVNADTTLGAVIGEGYVDDVLYTLFRDVKASELFAAMDYTTAILPDSLPEAGEKSLYDYIQTLLSSKEFYDSLYENSLGALPKGKTLKKLTLGEIGTANGWSEEETRDKIEKIKTYAANLKENLIGSIFALATNGSMHGKLDGAEVSLSFDAERQLSGVHIKVDGLAVTLPLPMAYFPQSAAFEASGTIDMTFPAEPSLTSLSGMRYLSDEHQKGVFEEGTTESEEYNWNIALGKDEKGRTFYAEVTLATAVTVEQGGVTYRLIGEDAEIDLEFFIPMEDIKAQLRHPDKVIATELSPVHEGQPYSMTLQFQFEEDIDNFVLSIDYQTRLDNAPSGDDSYGSGPMPYIWLPYARGIKTIA